MVSERGNNVEEGGGLAKRPDAHAAALASRSKTVALVGFSCSGKSTLGKRVLNAFKQSRLGPLTYCDSDDEIGKPFGGIAELYMNLGYDAALEYVADKERAFLKALQPSGAPRLVVAGPNVVLRDLEWQFSQQGSAGHILSNYIASRMLPATQTTGHRRDEKVCRSG